MLIDVNEMNDNEILESIPNRRRIQGSVSNEKRQSLIKMVIDNGKTIKDAAVDLDINYSTARTIISQFHCNKKIFLSRKGGSCRRISTPDVCKEIEDIISENPGLTLMEIKSAVEALHQGQFQISISTINRCLSDLLITVKRAHRELDRVNLATTISARKEYALWFNNYSSVDFANIVFVDESSFNLHCQRSQARSKKGTRANVVIPTIRGRSVSLISSMSIKNMLYSKIISNSTVNGDVFTMYLTELCTYLRYNIKLESGCIILDNARVHKREELLRVTSEFGYDFKFLSPYSYMLNPIENCFSKIKNGVRSKLRQGANGNLSDIILKEIDNVTSDDCSGYFRYISRNITNCAAELPYKHN